jgi:quinolinate synthase
MAISATTLEGTYQEMKKILAPLLPDFEIKYKSEIVYEINRLKKEKGAVILGHNYMEPALFHTVPDIVGDSLELSRKAATVEAQTIIFCGVKFMAETAKILNPTRTVLLPARKAGCSLAEAITVEDVKHLREQYPGIPIVTYINTYADVKAECDIVCTSGNAHKVVESLGSDTVIFLPDEYLARNVAAETGKKIIVPKKRGTGSDHGKAGKDFDMIGWHGKCEVHERFSVEDIENVRKQFPDVVVLSHPECSPEVVAKSDFSGSTSRMVQFVKETKAPHFLILTECSMGDNIMAENQDKDILRMCSIRCPHMNEITLEDTLHALRFNEQIIEVPEDVRVRAKRAIDRMLAIH